MPESNASITLPSITEAGPDRRKYTAVSVSVRRAQCFRLSEAGLTGGTLSCFRLSEAGSDRKRHTAISVSGKHALTGGNTQLFPSQ